MENVQERPLYDHGVLTCSELFIECSFKQKKTNVMKVLDIVIIRHQENAIRNRTLLSVIK